MWQRWLIVLLFLTFAAPLAQANQFEAATTPTADFTDNNDGTVTHKTTGMTWKRCAEGQTWAGGTCTGTAATYTWAQATALTASFAGKSDWRLPTIRELSTIAEMDVYNPAINTTIFPNTPASDFWSASAVASDSGYAWDVNFDYGFDDSYSKSSTFYVRLVRGGQSLGLLALSRPTTDYVDNGDGSVTHTPTALTWKRCAEGQTWSGSACSGTAKTYTWSAANALSAGDWRLPTQAELRSLVDFTLTNPSINTTIFPNTPASYFWSASAYAGGSGSAWGVGFNDGNDYPGDKTGAGYVRLVRGGQSLGSLPTVSSVTPSSATLDQLTTFTVQGQNLTSGMGFTVGDCEYSNAEVGSGSSTQRTFECTPRGTTGTKTSLVKTAPGGTTLYSFSVEVTSADDDLNQPPDVFESIFDGTYDNLTFSVNVNPPADVSGKSGKYYIGFISSDNQVLFRTDMAKDSWVPYKNGAFPPAYQGILNPVQIPVAKNANFNKLSDGQFFMGYQSDDGIFDFDQIMNLAAYKDGSQSSFSSAGLDRCTARVNSENCFYFKMNSFGDRLYYDNGQPGVQLVLHGSKLMQMNGFSPKVAQFSAVM